jgi:hypothetical protein
LHGPAECPLLESFFGSQVNVEDSDIEIQRFLSKRVHGLIEAAADAHNNAAVIRQNILYQHGNERIIFGDKDFQAIQIDVIFPLHRQTPCLANKTAR